MRGVGRSAAALRDIGKPTIAKVNGVAAGAGLNLALGCDLVIASDAARFSAIFVQRGPQHRLRRLVVAPAPRRHAQGQGAGVPRRRDRRRRGRTHRHREPGRPRRPSSTPRSTRVVARLLQMAPIALAQTKHLLDQAFTVTFAEAVEAEAAAAGGEPELRPTPRKRCGRSWRSATPVSWGVGHGGVARPRSLRPAQAA